MATSSFLKGRYCELLGTWIDALNSIESIEFNADPCEPLGRGTLRNTLTPTNPGGAFSDLT